MPWEQSLKRYGILPPLPAQQFKTVFNYGAQLPLAFPVSGPPFLLLMPEEATAPAALRNGTVFVSHGCF